LDSITRRTTLAKFLRVKHAKYGLDADQDQVEKLFRNAGSTPQFPLSGPFFFLFFFRNSKTTVLILQ
ncbi:MAG: hypothetical protein WBW67_02810, partial [Pseudolabrys sp.]